MKIDRLKNCRVTVFKTLLNGGLQSYRRVKFNIFNSF